MAKGFKNGASGGGSELAFRVLSGTVLPSSPKENDIWVNTDAEIRGWQFGADDPNLLDFTTWANGIDVHVGTKSVSGNSVTLTANASGDCHTDYAATSKAKIPCTPGKTYIMQWDHSGSDGWVYLFPNADMAGLVLAAAEGGKLEYTAEAGVTFFTFRIGVQDANASAVYSNIRITEKDRAFSLGSVWIITGATSPVSFNVLKKNSLMVYPLKASQYIGGTWVEKTAKSYQGGAWVDWTLYLFNNGDQCVSLTGAWAEVSKPSNTTITIGDVLAVKSDSNGQTVSLSTVGAVDLTDAKTLWITSPGSDSGRYAGIVHLCTSKDISTSAASVTLGDSAGYKSGTYSIDVSSLNGSYYIFMIATAGQYGAGYADASEIWME